MMSKTGSVPKLRFPEFCSLAGWEEKRLGEVVEVKASGDLDSENFSDSKTHEHIYPIYSNSVTQEGLYGFSNYPKYPKDSVTVTARGTLGVAFYRDHEFVGIGRLLILSAMKTVDARFLELAWNHLAKIPLENGGIPQLTAVKARAVELSFPLKDEQQKIADCLTSVDDLITAEAEKLAALKDHKKGLMQQLFPREGETRPRLRFPEFRDAVDWEEKNLGKVATFHSGGTPSKNNPEYWDGDIPWISALSMHDYAIGSSEAKVTKQAIQDGAKIVPSGTLLLLVRGSMLHNRIPIGITTTEVTFNQDVKALSLTGDVSEEFLLNLLIASEWDLLRIVTKTGIGAGKLDSTELNAFTIKVPSPREQQKIVDCLTPLNELVEAQTLRLEKLKDHKKGLDPPPLKWSARIVRKRRIKYGNQASQTGRDCHEVAAS